MKNNFQYNVNKAGYSLDPYIVNAIKRSIYSMPTPSLTIKRLNSSKIFNPKNNTAEKHVFNNFGNKFKQRYLTPLKNKFASYLNYKPNYYTFDIETFNHHGKATPYILGVYSPDSDFKGFQGLDCIKRGLDYILTLKPNKDNEVLLYAHNGGNFDAYILINEIMKSTHVFDDINILKDPKNNSIYLFSFIYLGITYNILDSYKKMPVSLASLIKEFNIDVDGIPSKLPFNHEWVNINNINYIGKIPLWLKEHKKELQNLGVIKGGKFNFVEYSMLYNKVDTIALHKVLVYFHTSLIKTFNIDLSYLLTIASMAMTLFKARFYDFHKNKIYLIPTELQNVFSQGYYGSVTQVLKPHLGKAWYYDINSMYPACMLKLMPVGKHRVFNKKRGLNELFGIGLFDIDMPEHIKHPSLPVKREIDGIEKLIYPHGKWKGVYFSEEVKYAQSQGCKVKIINAWEFDKSEDLFKEWVEKLYELKKNGGPGVKLIFKLFLNSLYGKFGQSREYLINILSKDRNKIEEIDNTYSEVRTEVLPGGWFSCQYSGSPNPELINHNKKLYDKLKNDNKNYNETRQCNIAIAVAITAYARIEIFTAVNKLDRMNIDTVYIDTDAIVINKPMPIDMIGDNLGEFKNELADKNYDINKDMDYYMIKPVFLRDKVYAYISSKACHKIKFSGYKKSEIDNSIYQKLLDILHNKRNSIEMSAEYIRKNPDTFEILHKKEDRSFVFNYDKRIKIFKDGVWVDTKPLNINNIETIKEDFVINKDRLELPEAKTYVKWNEPTEINIENIINNDYKEFDGRYIIYTKNSIDNQPILNAWEKSNNIIYDTVNPLASQEIIAANKYTSYLKTLILKAEKEGLLFKGSRFLITETYSDHAAARGHSNYNTIWAMESYIDSDDLLTKYSQHIEEKFQWYWAYGGSQSFYYVHTLHLRISIPLDIIKRGSIKTDKNNGKTFKLM